MSSFARTWATDTIRRIRSEFEDSNGLYRDSILKELLEIENKIPDIQYAFEDETEGDGAVCMYIYQRAMPGGRW